MKKVIDYIEENSNTELPKLKRFALLGKKERQDELLAKLVTQAESENWTSPNSQFENDILYNYLLYTFDRLVKEDKVIISEDEQFAAFNTGLLTKYGVDIICLFNRYESNMGCHWHINGFYAESDRQIAEVFESTPLVAEYFDNPEDMFFNPKWEIIINNEHILEDNISRFPEELSRKGVQQLQMILSANMSKIKKKIARNYRLVVPQYYNDQITYLIPIEFEGVTMALAVEKLKTKKYRANTIFNLNMAYQNARLLMKPESDWLQNKKMN